MTMYSFEIVVGGIRIESDDDLFNVSDALYEAGCIDSHPAAYNGTLYVPFTREADSYEEAVKSAIVQIESIHRLQCLSVDVGGLVSLTDAAELAGVTKAALSRYSKGQRGKGDFPSPILRVDSNRPLWSWGEIAVWLESMNVVDHDIVEQAKTTEIINTALSIRNANMASQVMQYFNVLNKNGAAMTV